MDKVEKFLRKLTKKELVQIEPIIADIVSGAYAHHEVKKLKGYANIYRIRVGNIRIIFIEQGSKRKILTIGRRDDQTYRDF